MSRNAWKAFESAAEKYDDEHLTKQQRKRRRSKGHNASAEWEHDMEVAKAQLRGEIEYGYSDMLIEEDSEDGF